MILFDTIKLVSFLIQHMIKLVSFLISSFSFLIGFDLNLSLDEYGAFDFDFVQNLVGNFFGIINFFSKPWLLF
jgi:hypothetical protein